MESTSRSLQYSEVLEDLSLFVEKATSLRGLMAIVLYGSYSRGDFGAKSDIDLYILFDNVSNAKDSEDRITEIAADLRSFTKPIVGNMQEIAKTEPSLLQNIIAEGKVLYWRGVTHELQASRLLDLEPWLIFRYGLGRAKATKKSRVAYALYGKKSAGSKGLIQQLRGTKLGRGAFMIPESSGDAAAAFLRKEKIEFEKFRVWASK